MRTLSCRKYTRATPKECNSLPEFTLIPRLHFANKPEVYNCLRLHPFNPIKRKCKCSCTQIALPFLLHDGQHRKLN